MAKMQLSDNFDRGAFGLEHPGTYHLIVVAADEYPKKRGDGSPIAGWKITLGVLAGTESRENGKEVEVILNHPNANHRDGGEFCRRMQSRFLLVTGIVDENQAGQEVDINLDAQAPGRQFVARFTLQPTEKNSNNISIDGANIWHVDDEAVKEIPKDQRQLAQLPESLRLKAKPAEKPAKKTAPAKPADAPATEYSEPIAATGGGDSLYDNL